MDNLDLMMTSPNGVDKKDLEYLINSRIKVLVGKMNMINQGEVVDGETLQTLQAKIDALTIELTSL
mgnify:CR=1 FL=1